MARETLPFIDARRARKPSSNVPDFSPEFRSESPNSIDVFNGSAQLSAMSSEANCSGTVSTRMRSNVFRTGTKTSSVHIVLRVGTGCDAAALADPSTETLVAKVVAAVFLYFVVVAT